MGETLKAWSRLGMVVAGAVIGLTGGWLAIDADAPRWVTVWAGGLLVIGIGCSLMLIALAWLLIVEEVRPRIVARRPALPLSLATEQAAMFGSRRFNMHPVRFWAGLSLNHRFFFGVILFEQPKTLTFATPTLEAQP